MEQKSEFKKKLCIDQKRVGQMSESSLPIAILF